MGGIDESSRSPITLLPVEVACVRWRAAFDAADAAIDAAGNALSAEQAARHRGLLVAQRSSTLVLLKALARDEGVSGRFVHLTPVRDERRLLGLPSGVVACVFDLEGVLVASVELHRAAWSQAFDEFAVTHLAPDGSAVVPFDPQRDYARHLDGKPRLEGMHAFLASRGLQLPEGNHSDPPGSDTVYGLANRKNELLQASIERLGVRAYDGSWQYLETAREAGIRTAVVSASANTHRILQRAGLDDLVDTSVDGTVIVTERLRENPAPDRLLAACSELRVDPKRAAVFETNPNGVAAARAADFAFIVGIHETGHADELRREGADLVVGSLAQLLELHLPSAQET
jgi:beta-phosphoglucomutase-like phosphatase (HAD superfamily)